MSRIFRSILDMAGNVISNLGTPTQATDAATKGYVDTQRDSRVAKTGDTMSGTLTVPFLTSTGGVQVQRPSGSSANLEFTTDAKLRWTMGKGPGAETGADAGAEFNIAAWDDAGNWKSNPISIRRSDGKTTFDGNVDLGGNSLDTGMNGTVYTDYLMASAYSAFQVFSDMDMMGSDVLGVGQLSGDMSQDIRLGSHINAQGKTIWGLAEPTNPDWAATKAYVDSKTAGGGGPPPGVIEMYGGPVASPPTGYLVCNGQLVSRTTYAALFAAIGTIHGAGDGSTTFAVPDLRDRFIAGAGTTYNPAATGGAATVQLTAAESGVPAHGHTASSAAETADHVHSINPPSTATGTVSADHTHSGTSASGGPTHTHDDSVDEGITTGDSNDWVDTADDDTTGVVLRTNIVRAANTAIGHTHTLTTGGISANHTHAVDIAAFNSAGRSAAHTHTITVDNNTAASAASAHENRPPYYALVFIIKI